jgi:hypothetical protein
MKTFRVAMLLAVIAPMAATAQVTTAKPSAEITKLASQLVGSWTYEAVSKANPYSPAGKTTGTDVYELGPGGFSVSHHWNEKDPIGQVTGLEVIAFDASRRVIIGSYFTSLGEVGGGTMTVAGNVYTYATTGVTWEGKTAASRCTWTFATPKSLKVKCDASPDGKAWTPGVFEGTWTKKG